MKSVRWIMVVAAVLFIDVSSARAQKYCQQCDELYDACQTECVQCDGPVTVDGSCMNPGQSTTCSEAWGCCPNWSCNTEVTGKWQITGTFLGFGFCLPMVDQRATCEDTNGCFGSRQWCTGYSEGPRPVIAGLDCCEIWGECWGSRCH